MKAFIVMMLLSGSAYAHQFKTKDFCSATTKDMCAHIGYDAKPEASKAFEFTFDIINKIKAKDVKDMVIDVVTKSAKGQVEYVTTTWTIRPDGHHWDAKASAASANEVTGVRAKYTYNKASEEITVNLK